MNTDKFWKIVEEMDWKNNKDYHDIKMKLMAKYSKEEMVEFRKIYNEMYIMLDDAIEASHVDLGLGDDSYGDCLKHVIGLGKTEYEKNLKDPRIMIARANKNAYTECCSYAIPYENDYGDNSMYTKKWLVRLAKGVQSEIALYRKMDVECMVNISGWLNPIDDDLNDIDMLCENFLNNPDEGIEDLYKADWVFKACKKIDKFFRDNYNELPRKFTGTRKDGSCHNGMCTARITNLIHDAKKVRKFLKIKAELV